MIKPTDSPEQIKEKYLALRKCYRDLMGTLYPSITYRDLIEMRNVYVAATGQIGWGDLPIVPAPNQYGQVPYFNL